MPGAASRLDLRALQAHALKWPASAPLVARMSALLGSPGDPFSGASLAPGHFTASAFVLCPERRRVLLIHHAKLRRWLQPGGHVEPSDPDLRSAAEREVAEETGVTALVPLAQGVFDVDIHPIPATPKNGAHLHFDVRFAFLAASDRLVVAPEVLDARWVELDGVRRLTEEESVLRCVDRLRSSTGA